MNIPYVMKRCTKCGRWLVASEINFYKQKYGKYKLGSRCKECEKKRRKQYREDNREKEVEWHKKYYEANRDKILEQHKQYRENNKEKIAEGQRQYYQDNKDKIGKRHKRYYEANKEKLLEQRKQCYQDNKEKEREKHKQYYENNKEKVSERHKQYRENNKEKIAEGQRQYYKNNKDKVLERCKQYREDNKEKIAERNKRYYQSPQGQASSFNRSHRRRIKEEAQGTGITKDQWLEMMKFFDFRCAYSGERLTNKTRSVDHIVPLNSGGDNMIWNCVPMTRSLNSSKSTKGMEEWYKEQECYDPKRLQKIYEWQEHAYNKWGKNSDYFNTNDIQIKLL